MLAARNGNVDAIKVLLDHKADVNAKDKLRGTTALMWAAEQAHPEAVKAADRARREHLGCAVRDRHQGQQGLSGAHGEADSTLRSALGVNAAGADPDAELPPSRLKRRAEARSCACQAAAQAQQKKTFRRKPTKLPHLPHSDGRPIRNGGGLTPLVYAAREDCLECVKTAGRSGADVNQTTHYGWTPLLTATQNRHYKLAAYLLDHGADPNIANNGGWTPLYWPPTTATSKAAIIRCGSRTWIIWISSSC